MSTEETTSSNDKTEDKQKNIFSICSDDNTFLTDAQACLGMGFKIGVFAGSALAVVGLANALVSHMMPTKNTQ